MSRTTTSAPAAAKRRAWLRPCPRAPPVTSTTLSANEHTSGSVASVPAECHRERFARDELGCVGGEEEHCVRHVVGLEPRARYRVQRTVGLDNVFGPDLRLAGEEQLVERL